MNFFRNLARDLVDKKLWPVAAALVLGLVAVPVLLGGGSETTTPRGAESAAAAPAGGPVANAAQVSLDSSSPAGKRSRPGAVRNPFKQLNQAKAATTAASAPSSSSSTGKSGASGAGGSSDAGKSPSTGATPSTGPTKVDTPSVTTPVVPRTVAPTVAQRRVYRVAVRFGEMGALETKHDAARLTALPSTAKPMVLFLGVRSDGKTAVFLVNPGVQAHGEGWCRPTPAKCETLEMRAGDHEVLEVASGTAGVVQYHLVVARVVKRTLKSSRTAARKHRRESKSGRELLRTAIAKGVPGIDDFRFDLRYGVLRAR